MDVQVSLYGALVQPAGGRTRTVSVEGPAPTVGDLRAAIVRQIPALAGYMGQVAIGMGTELYPDEARLLPDREIALLPPVSGG